MLDKWLYPLYRWLHPPLDELPPRQREIMLFSLGTSLRLIPFNLLTLAWLVWVTDTAVLRQEIWLLLLHFVLLVLISHYTFTLRFELHRGFFVSSDGSLSPLVVSAAAFLVGPTALWLTVVSTSASFIYNLWRSDPHEPGQRWNYLLTLLMGSSYGLLGGLGALFVYERLGGTYPLADLTWPYLGPAVAAVATLYLFPTLLFLPRMRTIAHLSLGQSQPRTRDIVRFTFFSSALSSLQYPFAVLAAALWSQQGVVWYLFFLAGVWLAGVLASRLSDSVTRSEQRARELAHLERLGQAIIAAPPDASALPDLVAEHVEGMLPSAFLFIWLEPDQILFRSETSTTESWESLKEKLTRGDIYQWQSRSHRRRRDCLLIAIRQDDQVLSGGMFAQLRSHVEADTADFMPALQSLSGQIASAVRRAEAYRQALASERMRRELQVAGEIQASFLPRVIPQLPGWDIAAVLHPARQTSGDFYDFIELTNGRLACLVADVADKGTGAALFMALSRTLLRTYAHQYPGEPARVLAETSERILADTHASQFVTLFYAVLNLATGDVVYANAGHNPALLLPAGKGEIVWLPNSGPPLGVMEGLTWQERDFCLAPGDTLLLYTDGVTEAHNETDELFAEERLVTAVQSGTEQTAAGRQTAVLQAVAQFSGQAPQSDDIALLTIRRR